MFSETKWGDAWRGGAHTRVAKKGGLAKKRGRPRKDPSKTQAQLAKTKLRKPELSALRDKARKGGIYEARTMNSPEARELTRRALVLGSGTAGTREAAQGHWEQWRRYCEPGGVGPWLHEVDRQTGEDLVIDYIAFLFLMLGYTWGTV